MLVAISIVLLIAVIVLASILGTRKDKNDQSAELVMPTTKVLLTTTQTTSSTPTETLHTSNQVISTTKVLLTTTQTTSSTSTETLHTSNQVISTTKAAQIVDNKLCTTKACILAGK